MPNFDAKNQSHINISINEKGFKKRLLFSKTCYFNY